MALEPVDLPEGLQGYVSLRRCLTSASVCMLPNFDRAIFPLSRLDAWLELIATRGAPIPTPNVRLHR